MPITFRHDHVAIRVADFDAAVAFYTEKLDFTVDQTWPFGDMQLAYLSNGSAKVELLAGDGPTPHGSVDTLDATFGQEEIHHFCVAVDDVDATLAELRDRGVNVLGASIVVEEIGRRLGFFTDQSGNIIELSAPR